MTLFVETCLITRPSVLNTLGNHHFSHTEYPSASASTCNAATSYARAALPHAQRSSPSFATAATIAHPVVNRGVTLSESRAKCPASCLLRQGSSQLQYTLPLSAVLSPMTVTAASQYYQQMHGQASYVTPIIYHLNSRVVPTSS